MTSLAIRTAHFDDLDVATLYALLRLRVDVFVVEQACPYHELDGLDAAPSSLHCWTDDDGVPVAYLRIVADQPGGALRIGRVVTAATHRHRGLAAALLRYALELTAPADAVLGAQAHLVDWYRSFGFAVDGPEYVEDGIPHVPMRLRR